MKILNLTQHTPTAEQLAAGVADLLPAEWRAEVLTFTALPALWDVRQRAVRIARRAAKTGLRAAMIGGAPFLMGPLTEELLRRGITPKFAFTLRECVETALPDGGVKKTMVFRHLGFVEGKI